MCYPFLGKLKAYKEKEILEIMETNKRTKILTNSGFKYEGTIVEQDNTFITIKDDRQGIIKVPLCNISLIKELE